MILSTGPEHGDFDRAARLAHAACETGIEVGLFVMHAAVRTLEDRPAAVAALTDDGCEIVACATSLEAFGVDEAACAVPLGSQDDHAALVHRADRVLAFT